jgi:hypothetical protein
MLRREGLAVIPGAKLRVYRLQTFEIADELRETYFGDNDMMNKWSCIVIGDDALFAKLEELNIPLNVLDSSRRVDYPL